MKSDSRPGHDILYQRVRCSEKLGIVGGALTEVLALAVLLPGVESSAKLAAMAVHAII